MYAVTKIAIAEDHTIFRETFASFCRQHGFEVVASARDGMDLLEQLLTCSLPDVIFMDIRMPRMNGKQTTALVTKDYPSVKVIALSSYEHEKHIIDMMNGGAKGYLTKAADISEVVKAVEDVLRGNAHYCPKMLEAWNIPNHLTGAPRQKKLKSILLNDREYEFISRCASDDSYKQIAHKMGVRYRTIDCFRASVFTKLKIASRAGVAIYSVLHGLLDFSDENQYRR